MAVTGDITSASRPVAEPKLIVEPAAAPVPKPLRQQIGQDGFCGVAECRLVLHGPSTAILLAGACDTCPPQVRIYRQERAGAWTAEAPPPPRVEVASPAPLPGAAAPAGRVEVRAVRKQQVFVDGKPVGPLFD